MHRTLSTIQHNNTLHKLVDGTLLKKLQTKPISTAPVFLQKENNSNPQNLPHLPVPKLDQTLSKYLTTVKPFLSEHEFKATSDVVAKFGADNGLGPKLQHLLVEKAKRTENWLADWWLRTAYLQYRSPVVVFSSPGLVFPFQDFKNEDERLGYSAKLILAALNYKLLIDSEQIPLEKMGKDPLDMSQYKKIFGTCRIPGIKEDGLEFHSQSRHIVVVHNNNFFGLQVFDNNDKMISEKQLLEGLSSIVEESETPDLEVGVLTTEHRDTWGKVYQELIKDPVNRFSIQNIQSSLFLVCLDGPMPRFDDENRQTVAGKQFIHGGGSAGNAGNRWYDKTVQFIIGQDGAVGLTYEHSPSEGQPIAVMTDYLMDFINANAGFKEQEDAAVNLPERLPFNVSPEIEKAIDVANVNVDKLVDNLDMDSFTFKSFGKEFIKTQKLSPDSFIQIAMQYAFYRIHKVPGAHYESAATRKYVHGRTETIRSCSTESIAFAKTMLDSTKTDAEKVAALKLAIDTHKRYCVEALNGFGVDRHLLGLKLVAVENKLDVPELFKDESFARSAHMRISSSQVATKCDGFMCYAPLVEDGYGCCYNPRPHDINFGVSAFVSHPDTSAKKYRQALEDSLLDMHNVLLKTMKSKL